MLTIVGLAASNSEVGIMILVFADERLASKNEQNTIFSLSIHKVKSFKEKLDTGKVFRLTHTLGSCIKKKLCTIF